MRQQLMWGGSEPLKKSLEGLTSIEVGVDLMKGRFKKRPVSPNYTGLCIFHKESSPSLVLRARDGTYHCYGCGMYGGPLDLIFEMFLTRQRKEENPDYRGYLPNITWSDPVAYIAEKTGLSRENNEHRGRMIAALRSELEHVKPHSVLVQVIEELSRGQ